MEFKEKIKISIDSDDVILDFVSTFCLFCAKRNPPIKLVNGMKGPIASWFGLTKEQFRKIHEEFTETLYYDTMPLVKGFTKAVPTLMNLYDSFILTARSHERKERTFNCIKSQVSEFSMPIFFSGEFYGNGKTKGEICRKQGAKIHIDDNLGYIPSLVKNGISVLLFDQPWNRDYQDNNLVQRVVGWEDALNKLEVLRG